MARAKREGADNDDLEEEEEEVDGVKDAEDEIAFKSCDRFCEERDILFFPNVSECN